MSAVVRVGHKGADLLAPGNTLASFDAALEAGVDMIEFDVLPEDPHDRATSRLVLSHDYTGDVTQALSLEEGLRHLAATGIPLDVDLKITGYEERVLEALRAHDLLDRALISSVERSTLSLIRALEPSVRLGWSVPKARRDYTLSPLWKLPALGALAFGRTVLPFRGAAEIRAGFCDALMVHWRLATPRLVQALTAAGGELYVWTVDSASQIRALEALGVTGVITNDPTLFRAR